MNKIFGEQTIESLIRENHELRRELDEANGILGAIQNGEVDALLVSGKSDNQVYILEGADHIYRVLLEEMQEGCATIGLDGTILFSNKNFASLLKTPLNRIMGSSIYNLLKIEDRYTIAYFLLDCEGNMKLECSLKNGDDQYVPVIISASKLTFDSQPIACLVVTDLTEQKQNERFTQMILNQAKEPIISCDRQGRIILANPAAVNMLGEHLIGMNFSKAVPLTLEADGSVFCLEQVLDNPLLNGVKVRYQRYDGRTFNLIVNAGRFESDQDSPSCGSVITLTDITDKWVLSNEMARFDRLNLVGEMAAGIGHEVRNPLTTVRGYLQMFQHRPQYADHREQFTTMIEELDRANSIITEFLSLAKSKSVDLKPGNLNGTIHALFPLLQAEAMRQGHQIQSDIGDIPTLCYDDKEIRQLILNLVRNGLEAMENSGMITIETYMDKDHIVLTVADTGSGIPPEVLEKLGTPFITTKEGGTGLGLSVCYRIAERHDAKIEVKTSPKGTKFFVKFKVNHH